MDAQYDVGGAVQALELICAHHDDGVGLQLSKIQEWSTASIQTIDSPRCWKLSINGNDDTQEEVVLAIQGIITRKDLPPMREATKGPNAQRYLRQSIQLTGLGGATFASYIDKLSKLHEKFSRHVPEGELLPLSIGHFRTFACLDLTTRYFTSRRDDPDGVGIPFGTDIDPRGILRNMITDQYFHGQDNEVKFYVADTHGEAFRGQNFNFQEARPTAFRCGDIVEAQMTVAMVPVHGKGFKMALQLRSLALINSIFSQVGLHSRDNIQGKTESLGSESQPDTLIRDNQSSPIETQDWV